MHRPNAESPRARNSIFSLMRDYRPLERLVGDDSKGWRSERNLLKCLNHLPLLRRKEEIAEQLGLHNTRTPSDLFERNYRILESHHRKETSTRNAIQAIATNIGMPPCEVEARLAEYAVVGHCEFHPSDRCNLRCQGCTYAQGVKGLCPKQTCFPFDQLKRLTVLQPRSMLFSGGGEPTLYSNGRRQMDQLVARLREILPKTLFALITNGTHVPPGRWTRQLKWVRLSIDAATPETYQVFRGKPLFDRVERHLLTYLDTSISAVGGSFLYSKANIHEYVAFLRHFLRLVLRANPNAIGRLNLTFRPLRQNPKDNGRPFPEMVTDRDIEVSIEEIRALAAESPVIERFLREQTNVEAVLGGNLQPAQPFRRCYYSQIFHIVRANGDVRPCFVRVREPEFSLGNLITDSPEAISLRVLYIGARRQEYCDARGCRQCHVNYILEQGLEGKLSPSTSPSVAQDPFF